MKICRISLRIYPQIGGLENHVYYLSKAQAKKSNEVDIIIPKINNVPHTRKMRIFRVSPFEIFPMTEKSKCGKISELLKILFFLGYALKTVISLNKKRAYHIIHVHGGYPLAVFASICKFVFNCRVVLTIHSSILPSKLFRMTKNILNPLRKLSAIICVSESIRSEIIRLGVDREKTFTISSGIDLKLLDDIEIPSSYDTQQVIFVGRLREVKGIPTLLKAIAILKKTLPSLHVSIVGTGPNLPMLRKKARELNIEQQITFRGQLSHVKVLREIAQSAVLVLPSIKSREEMGEGRPTSILEALCLGVPVIASRIGGIPEIVKDSVNGYVVQPGNHIQLANKIKMIVQDKELRKTLSINAIKIRKEVDWVIISNRISRSYFQDLPIGCS